MKSDSMFIQAMVKNDLSEIMKIEALSFNEPWSEKAFLQELKNPLPFSFSYVLRTKDKEQLLGYTCFWILAQEVQLLTLAVSPHLRNQGLGSYLLKWVLKKAKEKKVSVAFLEVRSSNIAAIHLYKKHAFREFSRRKNYYTHPQEDALILINSTVAHFPPIIKEVKMAPFTEHITKKLSQQKKKLLTLQEQHKQLESKVLKLSKRKTLTPREELEKKKLQKKKLSTKDQLQTLIHQLDSKG